MVNFILFVVGLFLGGQVNRGIYRLAWDSQPVGPWSPPHPKAPPRVASDRLPVYGWLGLAREEKALKKPYFWVRPMAIELACAVGLPMLYQWVINGGQHVWHVGGRRSLFLPDDVITLYVQFVVYATLFGLMMVATFIDFDEKTIPDRIVVPGTVVAFISAAVFPAARLPNIFVFTERVIESPEFLKLTSPFDWAARLDGPMGLWIAISCLLGWWYALTPKYTLIRFGFWKGVWIHFASMRKYISWPLLATAGGCIVLTIGCWFWGGDHWVGLLSAIGGMAFGGGMVWAFRIVASGVLREEALGFGDVTLMGMLGAFLGWQPALLVFFMAPFAGAVIAILRLLIVRRRDIAYGPYLCAATVLLVLQWNRVWESTYIYFELGPWIPLGLAICLLALAVMLYAYLAVKRRILGIGTADSK